MITHEKSGESMLEDLYQVGKTKSLGYLPIETLYKYCGKTIEDIVLFAKENGLDSIVYQKGESSVNDGEVVLYHEKMLLDMLQKYMEVLNMAGVPTTSTKEYIDYISKETVHQELFPKAYIVIGKTFNDHRFRDIEI